MIDWNVLFDLVPGFLPFECMQARFMQQALVGLVLLAPIAATLGVHVVNARMAFFSDAISHTAFTGVALGILFSLSPDVTMPAFAVLVGVCIMVVQRKSILSSDTVIGVFFSAAVAFGLAIVSRDRSLARDVQRFLYGDILTIGNGEITALAALCFIVLAFQLWGYNRMLYIGLSPVLAQVHRVRVAAYQFVFSALLSLTVIFSVWAVGVLLVTALLIVPAAASRNFARSAGSMLWWAILISFTSSVAGLVVSAQSWAHTATGATIILISFLWFLASLVFVVVRGR